MYVFKTSNCKKINNLYERTNNINYLNVWIKKDISVLIICKIIQGKIGRSTYPKSRFQELLLNTNKKNARDSKSNLRISWKRNVSEGLKIINQT